jgi:hypothetical protein
MGKQEELCHLKQDWTLVLKMYLSQELPVCLFLFSFLSCCRVIEDQGACITLIVSGGIPG